MYVDDFGAAATGYIFFFLVVSSTLFYIEISTLFGLHSHYNFDRTLHWSMLEQLCYRIAQNFLRKYIV